MSEMDQSVELILAEYERRAADEARFMHANPEEFGKRVDEFLICVGPKTGRMLHLLATGANARNILELGASYGYSTIWLADAARATGGKVHSLELSQRKVDYAREQLARVGLAAFVEFHVGSALDTLPCLAGPFDFVLLDLWKDLYRACFELCHEKLAPGALVAADNMLFPPNARADAMAYQALVRAKPDMDSVLLPVGSGVELSRKRGGQDCY
jgi:predicted O-methyltransferase YrrM